jgi:hypothetical protein
VKAAWVRCSFHGFRMGSAFGARQRGENIHPQPERLTRSLSACHFVLGTELITYDLAMLQQLPTSKARLGVLLS